MEVREFDRCVLRDEMLVPVAHSRNPNIHHKRHTRRQRANHYHRNPSRRRIKQRKSPVPKSSTRLDVAEPV
jgi:hypothetical protein